MRYKALPPSIRTSTPDRSARARGAASRLRDPWRDRLATLAMGVIVPLLVVPLVAVSAVSPSLRVIGKATAGTTVTVDGRGFPARESIELRWDGLSTQVSATVGPNGRFRAGFGIPSDAASGPHALSAVRIGGTATRTDTLDLLASTTVIVVEGKAGSQASPGTTPPPESPAPEPSAPASSNPGPTIAPSAAPSATATSSPAPTATPAPTAPPTTAPTATPTGAPTTTPTPTSSPTPAPTPTAPPPAQSGDYLLMSRSALLARPTSGGAWAALTSIADGSLGSPNLCDQDNKHGVKALAAALVYARTGTIGYRDKARDAIMSAMGTEQAGCHNAILSLGRQLGAYVLAADFIDLAGSDDSAFRGWLSAIRTRNLGGHSRWYTLVVTSENSANNWGTFALASRVAASLYLGDSTDLARSWQVFGGYSSGEWAFQKTADWSASWSCLPGDGSTRLPIAINGGCTKDGLNLDGAPVEDASRSAFPVPSGGYVNEAMQGYVVQALLLERAGFDAFGVGNQAIRRVADFQVRTGTWNVHSTGYYVAPVVNRAYGTSFPVRSSGYGRVFGYTDWLYGT